MVYQQRNPTTRDLYNMFHVGIHALELAGWDKPPTEPVKHDPLLLKLAEQHRPVVRSHFDAAVPASWRMVSCPTCNTGWRTWAPGDVPFRCDTWQELLERGIVSE